MSKTQIFFLHFAGGNVYSYNFLTKNLVNFECVPIELPGRGQRMGEPLIRDFSTAVEDVLTQIVKKLNSPKFCIFGHSMGAYLALSVTELLEKKNLYPLCLFVSGNAGPGISRSQPRYGMSQVDFVLALRDLGGIPNEILEDQEIFSVFEPILRADFEIIEKHPINSDYKVQCPLWAMMGTEEEEVASIDNWSRFTRNTFRSSLMEGKHFFIHQHHLAISSIITSQIEKTTEAVRT